MLAYDLTKPEVAPLVFEIAASLTKGQVLSTYFDDRV